MLKGEILPIGEAASEGSVPAACAAGLFLSFANFPLDMPEYYRPGVHGHDLYPLYAPAGEQLPGAL